MVLLTTYVAAASFFIKYQSLLSKSRGRNILWVKFVYLGVSSTKFENLAEPPPLLIVGNSRKFIHASKCEELMKNLEKSKQRKHRDLHEKPKEGKKPRREISL